jgi:hypothetical protein
MVPVEIVAEIGGEEIKENVRESEFKYEML